MAKAAIKNIRIKDLLFMLVKMNMDYDLVDIVAEEEKNNLFILPVEIKKGTSEAPPRLNLDDDIDNLI